MGIHNDILVAGGYHDELFGINLGDGAIVWRFNAGNFINSQLVADGKVYFWSPTGWIYALDANSGVVLWRHKTIDYMDKSRPQNWASVMAELVAHDRHLYILAMDHVLHVLDLNTGDELAIHRLPLAVKPSSALTAQEDRDVSRIKRWRDSEYSPHIKSSPALVVTAIKQTAGKYWR